MAEEKSVEEYAARISADFKIKECPAFVTAAGKQSRGAKLLVFNDADIPLTKEAFNGKAQVNVGLIVVDVLSDGFSRVPYDCIKGIFKSANDAKALTEMKGWSEDPENSGQFREVTCYAYTIAEGPGAAQKKGERVDDCKWTVCPGMVLRTMMWAAPVHGAKPEKYKEDLIAAGHSVIKAFSLMEVEIACKGWSRYNLGDDGVKESDICPVKRGYGMSVCDMRPMDGASLYSVMNKLHRVIPQTLEENRQKQTAYQARFHSIKDLIQTQSLPFFVKRAGTETVIDLDATSAAQDDEGNSNPTQIKLSNWIPEDDGNNLYQDNSPIDISVADAMRATNAATIEDACCLLEVAAAAGALSLLVCYNQYRPGKDHVRSAYFAYPLVDTKVLLSSIAVPVDSAMLQVDESEKYFAFEAGFRVSNGDDNEFSPLLLISKDPFLKINSSVVNTKLPSPDFMLCASSAAFPLAKAYFARFVHPKQQDSMVIWSGYINMGKPQIHMQGAASASSGSAAGASAAGAKGKWMKAASAAPYDPFGVLASAATNADGNKKRPLLVASSSDAAPTPEEEEEDEQPQPPPPLTKKSKKESKK